MTRLGESEDVAYKRVGAARLLQQFPTILEMLANGRIHLTGLMLLRPHLTAGNHEEWLKAACGKSKRQIEKPLRHAFRGQMLRRLYGNCQRQEQNPSSPAIHRANSLARLLR